MWTIRRTCCPQLLAPSCPWGRCWDSLPVGSRNCWRRLLCFRSSNRAAGCSSPRPQGCRKTASCSCPVWRPPVGWTQTPAPLAGFHFGQVHFLPTTNLQRFLSNLLLHVPRFWHDRLWRQFLWRDTSEPWLHPWSQDARCCRCRRAPSRRQDCSASSCLSAGSRLAGGVLLGPMTAQSWHLEKKSNQRSCDCDWAKLRLCGFLGRKSHSHRCDHMRSATVYELHYSAYFL